MKRTLTADSVKGVKMSLSVESRPSALTTPLLDEVGSEVLRALDTLTVLHPRANAEEGNKARSNKGSKVRRFHRLVTENNDTRFGSFVRLVGFRLLAQEQVNWSVTAYCTVDTEAEDHEAYFELDASTTPCTLEFLAWRQRRGRGLMKACKSIVISYPGMAEGEDPVMRYMDKDARVRKEVVVEPEDLPGNHYFGIVQAAAAELKREADGLIALCLRGDIVA